MRKGLLRPLSVQGGRCNEGRMGWRSLASPPASPVGHRVPLGRP